MRNFALDVFSSGGALSRRATRRFYQWVADNVRFLPGVADLTEQQFTGRLTLERVLREEFRDLDDRTRQSHPPAVSKEE